MKYNSSSVLLRSVTTVWNCTRGGGQVEFFDTLKAIFARLRGSLELQTTVSNSSSYILFNGSEKKNALSGVIFSRSSILCISSMLLLIIPILSNQLCSIAHVRATQPISLRKAYHVNAQVYYPRQSPHSAQSRGKVEIFSPSHPPHFFLIAFKCYHSSNICKRLLSVI